MDRATYLRWLWIAVGAFVAAVFFRDYLPGPKSVGVVLVRTLGLILVSFMIYHFIKRHWGNQ